MRALFRFRRFNFLSLHNKLTINRDLERPLFLSDLYAIDGLGGIFVSERTQKMQSISRTHEFYFALAQVHLVYLNGA